MMIVVAGSLSMDVIILRVSNLGRVDITKCEKRIFSGMLMQSSLCRAVLLVEMSCSFLDVRQTIHIALGRR